VTVTDEQVAALRSYLSAQTDNDADQARQQFGRLAQADTAQGLGALLYTAFVIAARRKFSPRWTVADVVKFVADVRAQAADEPGLLDPRAAEHQLRVALGEEMPGYPDEKSRAGAQVILLPALADRLGSGPARLNDLLTQARALADQLAVGQLPEERQS
jgi:hypothetical protein